jgi:hypothetical protein
MAWTGVELGVNEQQFNWCRRNRRSYTLKPLFGEAVVQRMVGAAGRDVRRRRRAAQAWARVVPAALADGSEVLGLHGGELIVLVREPATRHALQQRVGALQAEMRRFLRGVKAIRLVGRPLGRDAGE